MITPTRTGLAERRHLARPDVGLDLHVSDVVGVVESEDSSDVVLVGHSSGGCVITGVADRVPDRIAHIVYLDAFVPEDGQSLLDLITPERRQMMETLVRTEGGGWLLARFAREPWETILREMWGVTDAADVRWMLPRLGPTPFGHFRDPVRRHNSAARTLPRTFIRCRQFHNPQFDRHAETARQTPGWRYRALPTSHHPAVTAPQAVADLLLEAAVEPPTLAFTTSPRFARAAALPARAVPA